MQATRRSVAELKPGYRRLLKNSKSRFLAS